MFGIILHFRGRAVKGSKAVVALVAPAYTDENPARQGHGQDVTDSNHSEGQPEIGDEERHEEELEDHSEAARIQELLHALREPYKEVFMWRVYGEKSFRDIGALFGKTENWACVTYHRAKRMIREGLED